MGIAKDLQEDKRKGKLYNYKYFRRGRKLKRGKNKAEQLHHMYHLEVDRDNVKNDFVKKKKLASRTLKRLQKKYTRLLKKRTKLVEKIKRKYDPKLRTIQSQMRELQGGLKAIRK